MKRVLILLAALCVLLCACTALAEENTTIATQIPATHEIVIDCGAHGSVRVNGKTYEGRILLYEGRFEAMTITAVPDAGWRLALVTMTDWDNVRLSGNKVHLDRINGNNVVALTFERIPTGSGSGTGSSVLDGEDILPGRGEETLTPMPQIADPILGEATLADSAVIPWMTPTTNPLYDTLLGTGSGLKQLHIVFDEMYAPKDYELLSVLIDDPERGNSLLVSAMPNENGETERRSLILSAAQLVKLVKMQETAHILFENGKAFAGVDVCDLLGGDVAKLMGLIVKGEKELSIERDWSLETAYAIALADLAAIDVEIRSVPVVLEGGGEGCEVSVWLRWEDNELEITKMLPSLHVGLIADGMEGLEDREAFTARYALGHIAPDAAQAEALESELLRLPDELPAHQSDTAAHFIVTIGEEARYPVTAYHAEAELDAFRHDVLGAAYAGEGAYCVIEVQE